MTKRTVSAILTAFILLPAIVMAGSVVFAPKNTFVFSSLYARAIDEALGDIENVNTTTDENITLSEENRYIVKFFGSAEDKDIINALENTEYLPLDENENRLFALSLENAGEFFGKYSEIIEYHECDGLRSTMAVVNDPAQMTAYETMNINSAWDKTVGSEEVIVAVLDTGVSRNHEDLENVNILAGYDAVLRKAGVYEDEAGHGTGITGIIAATANNSLGIAGVAHGVTILPVKVSASGTTIYSSDLVRGIRFAADAGAKIINMSIGGYSSSVAEQEAIYYAQSKGCILISAAGNGGNSEYADQKSYPASYNGVVSVASCNNSGEHSSFSQHNDAVDISAVGENITMPILDIEGRSVYRTDSGTSYACAFVSGIAALVASSIGSDARFESEEFTTLLIESCGNERDDRLGYGIINAETVVSLSEAPIITGVMNGQTYSESVTIGFNRGTATLNGEQIDDGETIVANGSHQLVITDGDSKKSIKFRLDYTPLSYEYNEFSTYAHFEFERGTAMLDGFPYNSGDRITASGRHEFTLTDGEERTSKTINLRHFVPSVYGITNGQTYNTPVEIAIVGQGSAELDGKEVFGEVAVANNGKHVLKVTSANGAVTEEYRFNITFPNTVFTNTDYADGKAVVDTDNGYICRYGDSLVGVRIYDIYEPEKFLHFLPVGRVYGHAFHGNDLLLFGDSGVTVLDRKTALNGQSAVINSLDLDNITYYTYAEGNVIGFGNGNIYTVELETGMSALLAETGYPCEQAFYRGGYYYILSPNTDSIIRVFDIVSGETVEYDIGYSFANLPLCYGAGYLAIGNKLYNAENGSFVMEFASQNAVKIDGTYIYTENRIIDIASGKEAGSFPFAVADIVIGAETNHLFGINAEYAAFSREAEGINAFGAAERNDKIISLSEQPTVYRTSMYYYGHSRPISVSAGEDSFYMLFSDKYALYGIQLGDKTEIPTVSLKYEPYKVIYSGGYVAVCFKNEAKVYVAHKDNISNGKYISLHSTCSDAVVANGKLFAIVGGTLSQIDITSEEAVITNIPAEDIAISENRIYILSGGFISTYNQSLEKQPLEISVISGNEIFIGNGIAIGRTVYNSESGEIIAKTDSNIIAFKGNTVVTEKGVFDLVNQEYIGNTGIYSPEFVGICGDNSVVAVGSGAVTVNSCAEGGEVVTDPEIEGIAESGVYLGKAVITYKHGVGYLDGKPFESGSSVKGVGSHLFSLSLPCGRNVNVPFNIAAQLKKIEFFTKEETISVGETVALLVKYLPEGAGTVPLSFEYDKNGLAIDESGVVTALKVGKYTVTARTDKENGNLSATAVITVRDDLIVLPKDVGITINRNSSLILGIPAGTKTEDLINMLTSGKSAVVLDKDGKTKNGYIATGDRLALKDDSGNTTDELYTVVRGDTDGDGCISAYDLYELELILQGYEYGTMYIAAADVDNNGVLANNDFRTLKKILFGRTETSLGTPDHSLFGICTVQTVSRIESGDIIDVAVCISGAKYARGVFGSLTYSDGLEFIEGESVGWDMGCYDRGEKVSFYAYDSSGNNCEMPFKVLLNLRFRVNALHATKITLTADDVTVSFGDECRKVRFQNTEFSVSPRVYNDFNIHFANANEFKFDVSEHEYSATIPYNSAFADITVTHKVDQEVALPSLVIPDSGEETLVITYSDESGATEFYTIHVKREDAPKIDSNCKLKTLEVEGHKLTPVFNPNYYEYSIDVPYDTEKINPYCIAQNNTAEINISDTAIKGDKTDVTITVIAPDGETLEYVIHVNRLPKPEEPIVNETPSDEEENNSIPSYVVLLISIGVLTAIAIFAKILRKTKQKQQNE